MQKFIWIFIVVFDDFIVISIVIFKVISSDFHLFLFVFIFLIFILCILHLLCELLSLSVCVRSIWQRFSCFDAFDETAAIKIYCETLNKDNVGAAFAVAVAVTVGVAVVVNCRCCPRVVSSVCRLKFSARQASSQLFAAHCAACLLLFVVVVVAVWLWNRQQ